MRFGVSCSGPASQMPQLPSPPMLPKLPGVLAERLAKLANVPTDNRHEFCGRISDIVQDICKRDRRQTGQRPGRHLTYAADAARTLQKEFFRIKKDDLDWIETIRQSQMQFAASGIENTGVAITNLSMILNAAVGRRSPLPQWLEKKALKTKDQILRELVFSLLAATKDTGGKLTFNKNSEAGSLAKALELLRGHLPKGLVPEPLPAATIQKLKADFSRFRR